MSEFDNSKQVIVRKVVSDNDKAPDLRVSFEVDGQKYQAGVWLWTKKDGTPVLDKAGNRMYNGNWEEDNYATEGMEKAKEALAPQAAPDFGDFADDVPF